MKKAVIVLPTYNEASDIARLLDAIFHQQASLTDWDLHVLVVDSSSPDGTASLVRTSQAKHPHLHIMETPKEGLGKAYLKGMRYAIDVLHAEVLFEMDADFSHDPRHIPAFLQEIDRGADLVIGTRYSKGGSIPANWGLHRKIYSIGANIVIRLGFMRWKNTEWTNGYRAIRRELVEKIMPEMRHYTGYVFQVAFLDKAINRHAQIAEIPIHFTDRINGISKINAPQYIIQTFTYVFTHSSFIKFCIVGFSGVFVDVGSAWALWKVVGLPVIVANRISMELAVISNYTLNNFWAFSHKRHSSASQHLGAFLKFNLVALGSFVIQELGIRFGIRAFGEPYALWYKVVTIFLVVIPYSYIFYNKVIWKKK